MKCPIPGCDKEINKKDFDEISSKKIDERVDEGVQKKLKENEKENQKKMDERVDEGVQKKLKEKNKTKDTEIESQKETVVSLTKTVENLNETVGELKLKRERDKKNFEEAIKKSKYLSPEIQGEVQERSIEDILKKEFIYDFIEPVPRGIEGGDCIQNIREPVLKNIEPKILFESKATQKFDKKWIGKLAKDMDKVGAAKGVLITKALPIDFKVGCKTYIENKIWVIPYKKDIIITAVKLLRDQLVEVAIKHNLATKSPEHIKRVYDYCMSDEFVFKVQKNIDDLLKVKKIFKAIKIYVDNKVEEGSSAIDDVTNNVKAIDDKFKSFGKLIDNKNKGINKN